MKDERDTTFVLFGIENQSHIHHAAPVKNLLYDAINYGRQVEAKAALHKKETDWANSDEFLGGFRKSDRLYPVVTLVLYWSDGEWDGPMTLHDMIDFGEEGIKGMVADYKINLLSPSMIDDFGKFHTELGEVLEFIKYSGDKTALQKAVSENEGFKHMERRSVYLINLVTNSKLQIIEEEETIDVCKAIQDIREEGRQEGRQEGFQQGVQYGEEQSQKKIVDNMLTSISNLMKTMNLTPQQAMDALIVPEADRAGYLVKLSK